MCTLLVRDVSECNSHDDLIYCMDLLNNSEEERFKKKTLTNNMLMMFSILIKNRVQL